MTELTQVIMGVSLILTKLIPVTLVTVAIFANSFELIVKRTEMNTNRSWADSAFQARRVPAEWEPQEAVWVQWPGAYEKS